MMSKDTPKPISSRESRAGHLPSSSQDGVTDPSGREAVLTIARSNGKTTLAAALAAAGLAGPLSVPRGQVIVVAASMGQARLTFEHTRWFLEPFVHEAPKDWRVIEHSHECRIEHRPTGAHMRAI